MPLVRLVSLILATTLLSILTSRVFAISVRITNTLIQLLNTRAALLMFALLSPKFKRRTVPARNVKITLIQMPLKELVLLMLATK